MMMKHIYLRVFLLLVLLTSAHAGPTSRPDLPGTATEVQVSVGLLDVDRIDGALQSFDANLYFTAHWQDDRLVHDGSEPISKPLNEVWHPRFQWINQQSVTSTIEAAVEVSPSGRVYFIQRVWGSFSSPLVLRDFPFDEQVFEVMIAAAGYGPDQVSLVQDKEDPSGLASRFSLPDWEVTGYDAGPFEFYSTSVDAESTAAFRLRFFADRHPGYFIFKFIFPLILIVAMSWTVFWIDPTMAGTQISVSTTAMLTLIAFRFYVDGSVPKVSYLTRMDIFILGSTVLVFATLVQAVATSMLARTERADLARSIDMKCRWIFPVVLGAVIALAFVGS